MTPISFTQVSKRYAGKPAVDNLSLEIAGGELVSLLGPSGCGKTTSLRMLAGFITPDSGDIKLGSSSVLSMGAEARPTAMVFQRYTLWPHMNIFHNIAFGLRLRRVSNQETASRVSQMLELVGLQGFEKRMPSQLSGGQQQRVALARALVVRPQVLLLDEPLSSLDARLRVALRDEIKAIQQQLGITTVFVTHDQEEALAVSDRIAVMNEGVLHQIATPSELYARPQTLFSAQFIGQMNLIPATIKGGWLEAGVFRLSVSNQPDGAVTLAIRPEDLEFAADGVAVTVGRATDLGHYRSLEVVTQRGQKLTVFADRGDALASAVRVRRAVFYRDERCVGEWAAETQEMTVH